ncbi:TonB-system energizer ExbB [Desulforegula conservatrix]|uniref:TonB-system energizer ExbB n=1 Tax=Desulforegula conservatrix TaxID=153026 RepID=UPI0004833ECB|nr:TonB-system energizer ExbB [Desulforegula conservatrix]
MEWIRQFTDYGIIGFLLLMSIIAFGIAIERKLYFRSIDPDDFQSLKSPELAMTKRFHVVATIGSNAPYIGLLGTVMGIMMTFSTIGEEGIADTGKIMADLSMAMKTTAAGLFVAIPAVVIYNYLLRAVRERILEWEIRRG